MVSTGRGRRLKALSRHRFTCHPELHRSTDQAPDGRRLVVASSGDHRFQYQHARLQGRGVQPPQDHAAKALAGHGIGHDRSPSPARTMARIAGGWDIETTVRGRTVLLARESIRRAAG